MITTLEIIERSLYDALLQTLLGRGLTVDPHNYHPYTAESLARLKADIGALQKFIGLYGMGNAQAKGLKQAPRIVIESHGFFPGGLGLPKFVPGNQGHYTEVPFETIDQYIDIRLISTLSEDNRLLHEVLHYSLPQRGYIKPFLESALKKTGNIYIELVNFYDRPEEDGGIIEKVYQYKVFDLVLSHDVALPDMVPLKEVTLVLNQLTTIIT